MNIQLTLRRQIYMTNRWWLSILMGFLFISTGIWIMTTLMQNHVALAVLFSILLTISGIMQILSSVSAHNELSTTTLIRPMLAGGIIDVTTSVIIGSAPLFNFLILSFFVALAPLFRSLIAIDPSFNLQKNYDKKWGVFVLIGIAGLVVILMLLVNSVPRMIMKYCAGSSFIGIGILRILLGSRMKNGI